jgi:hypothetical protein
LPRTTVAGEADANNEPLGVFVFAGVRFAVGRVQEEPSAPHLRLACIHLPDLHAEETIDCFEETIDCKKTE